MNNLNYGSEFPSVMNVEQAYVDSIEVLSEAFFEGGESRSSDTTQQILNQFIQVIEYLIKKPKCWQANTSKWGPCPIWESTSFCWLLMYLFEPKFQEAVYSKLLFIINKNFSPITVESFRESLIHTSMNYQCYLKPYTEFEALLTNHKSLKLLTLLTLYVKELSVGKPTLLNGAPAPFGNASETDTVGNLEEKSAPLISEILETKSLDVLVSYLEKGEAK